MLRCRWIEPRCLLTHAWDCLFVIWCCVHPGNSGNFGILAYALFRDNLGDFVLCICSLSAILWKPGSWPHHCLGSGKWKVHRGLTCSCFGVECLSPGVLQLMGLIGSVVMCSHWQLLGSLGFWLLSCFEILCWSLFCVMRIAR